MVLHPGTPLSCWGASVFTWQWQCDLEGCDWKKRLLDLNPSDGFFLDFCANHSLSITNTLFKHKGVHMCMWLQNIRGNKLVVHFVIILSVLQPSVELLKYSEEVWGWTSSEWSMFCASIAEPAVLNCSWESEESQKAEEGVLLGLVNLCGFRGRCWQTTWTAALAIAKATIWVQAKLFSLKAILAHHQTNQTIYDWGLTSCLHCIWWEWRSTELI